MENDLEYAIIAVCDTLNEQGVEYMIISGTAVGFHGYNRGTVGVINEDLKYDIDFWYKPTYRNFHKLMNSLEQMNCDTIRYNNATDIKKSFLKIEHSYFKTDFLPVLTGLDSFHVANERRGVKLISNVKVPFISLRDLITNKKASGRQYDLEDIIELQKQIRSQRKKTNQRVAKCTEKYQISRMKYTNDEEQKSVAISLFVRSYRSNLPHDYQNEFLHELKKRGVNVDIIDAKVLVSILVDMEYLYFVKKIGEGNRAQWLHTATKKALITLKNLTSKRFYIHDVPNPWYKIIIENEAILKINYYIPFLTEL